MQGESTIVCDALWGDSAKGKVANWIAYTKNYSISVRGGSGPNAGHSLYHNGEFIKTNQFPLAGILPTSNGHLMKLGVGSGVMFDPIKAHAEASKYNFYDRAFVDMNCSIITQEHKDREASGESYSESHSGSTKSGTGEARVDRVKRIGQLYRDYSIEHDKTLPLDQLDKSFAHCNCMRYLVTQYMKGAKIIVEGSQGFFLSLYLSPEYPVVTSTNCTATAMADSVGLPWNMIDNVVLVVKSAPTRVSQKCGDLPGEISKEEIMRLGIAEYGVTTSRLRRKSLTIPFDMLEDAILANQPSEICLSFCDHIDPVKGLFLSNIVTLNFVKAHLPKTFSNIIEIEKRFNVPVKYIEYGKEWNQISEIVYK